MVWIIIGVVVLAIVIYIISVNNSLVRLRNQSEESMAQIDAHLKQRFDLVPNLVETVKGYAAHEKTTLAAVIEARNKAASAKTFEEKDAANNAFGQTLSRLFALSEAYPDLKANTNFVQLQNQLTQIENELLAARKYYNAIIKQFNTKCEVFPSSVVAGMFRFTKQPYLQIEDEARANVKVRF